MKILYLTAGTGGFFCGACIRDNTLVHALRAQNHEVHLMPLYLPLTLDQDDASDCPLFLGGVNIWLQDKVKLFRHTPRFIDKLFDTQLFLKMAGQRAGMTDAKVLGHMSVNALKGLEGTQAKEIRRMQDWLRENLQIDLICVSNLLLLGLVPALREVFDVPVLATMQSEESFLDALPEPYKQEAWDRLRNLCTTVSGFVGISHFHARLMEKRLALNRELVHVVYNGIDLTGFSPATTKKDIVEIGFMSRMHPTKGLQTLVDAFIVLSDDLPEVRLRIIGSVTQSDHAFVAEQKQKIKDADLEARVTWMPNVTHIDKINALRQVSVVCVPTTYPEGFGLYILEALACGVPLILPDRGSFTELIDDTNGGIIYEVPAGRHEVDILASQLKKYLVQPELLAEFGREGHDAVHNRYDVESMAAGIAEAFSLVLANME